MLLGAQYGRQQSKSGCASGPVCRGPCIVALWAEMRVSGELPARLLQYQTSFFDSEKTAPGPARFFCLKGTLPAPGAYPVLSPNQGAQKGLIPMGITSSNKEISVDRIECGGTFQVTLSLTAEPNITSNPADIVLILDRSRSMAGSPLANLKNGAKAFIDIIDEATDGSQDGHIGSGSRIGVVSFAQTATQDTQLITSVTNLKAAVDTLSAGGSTNHADAFTKALQLFDPQSTNDKVMVLFTDGVTTAGGNPTPIASAAKAQGVTIYVIGLSGNGGVDVDALESWASSPPSAYVAITPDDAELEDLFEDLARNITRPGATNIVLSDTVADCFRITSLSAPSKGSASLQGNRTVVWRIDKLGVTQSEGAALTFTVEHVGPCSGTLPVNEAISYDDAEGNTATFPDPEITVDCGVVVVPEPCPQPVDLEIDGCEDSVEFDAGLQALESLGRILQLTVTLRNVCPHKRVALAAILTELDSQDMEHQRGMKFLTIPAHNQPSCRNVTVRCIKFVLPEDEAPLVGACNERRFRARIIAHYIDSGFVCCGDVT